MNEEILEEVCALGGEVLRSDQMQALRAFRQHGSVSRYAHCLSVAYLSLAMARRLRLHVDARCMVRGALLHDFFLYDWHDKGRRSPLHGFTHPGVAERTAREHFPLTKAECEVIRRHMFPLTPAWPKTREAMLVSLADKVSAVMETLGIPAGMRIVRACDEVHANH